MDIIWLIIIIIIWLVVLTILVNILFIMVNINGYYMVNDHNNLVGDFNHTG